AHLDRFLASFYPTRFLGDCLHGRKLLALEDAVAMLTRAPARLFGLKDRGVLAPGAHADIVVFDPETIDAELPRTVHDLPAGNKRLVSRAVGVEHVLVNGVETVRAGRETGETAGTVLRSGRDTVTPAITDR